MEKTNRTYTLIYEEFIKLNEEETTPSSFREVGKKYKEAGEDIIDKVTSPLKKSKNTDELEKSEKIGKNATKDDKELYWDAEQKTSLSKLEHSIYNKMQLVFKIDSDGDTKNPLSVNDSRLWDSICKEYPILNKIAGNEFIDKYYKFIIDSKASIGRDKYRRFKYMFDKITGVEKKFQYIKTDIVSKYRINFLTAGVSDDDLKKYMK